MRRRTALPLAALVLLPLLALSPSPAAAAVAPTPVAAAPGLEQQAPPGFELVGHSPLGNRGMNAALAVYGDYVYVGNRTDATPGHVSPGIQVVDVKDPSKPTVVGEIAPPAEGILGETTRELRVWPQQQLLMVMAFDCSALIHRCTSQADAAGSIGHTIRFYDLADPAKPKLISSYTPTGTPHEMHLWLDPAREGRALLYLTTPTSSTAANRWNLVVTDISGAREGRFTELVKFNPNAELRKTMAPGEDVRLHSMSVSEDGRRLHLAYLGAGYLQADSSDLADAVPNPQVRLVTDPAKRPKWGNPGAHSAVELPGRPGDVLMTDEVYGKFGGVLAEHGCPWGWIRMVDAKDPVAPTVQAEFKRPENEPGFCDTPRGKDARTENFTSFASHNPTLLGRLGLVTWHSAGLQAIDLTRPAKPEPAGLFVPTPLPFVATEDPALGGGPDKVVMWSFPVVKDGLIYVVDLRNGLYVLKYKGPLAQEVERTAFAEGNSNVTVSRARPASRTGL